eukprot:scaffold34607_cov177-Amphora_coffeaeformis.AAC.2
MAGDSPVRRTSSLPTRSDRLRSTSLVAQRLDRSRYPPLKFGDATRTEESQKKVTKASCPFGCELRRCQPRGMTVTVV